MPDAKTKFNPDRFPGVLEASSFRKGTSEFVWTIATPQRYEEQAKTMLGRLSSSGVFFYIVCDSPEEWDGLLKQDMDADIAALPAPGAPNAGLFCTVEEMADIFSMTVRYVQMLEKKGLFVKTTHGHYDLRASVRQWEQNRRERGKISDLNQKRAEKLEKQNRELDRLNLVAMKKLVNAEDVQRARELENANIRQKFLYLKALAPGLEGRTVNEIEKRLNEYANKALGELDRSAHGADDMDQETVSEKGMQAHDISPQRTQRAQRKTKKK